MPVNVPRILIIDDSRVDGIKIAEAIWSSGYPVRYLEYPAEVASTGANKFIGVRVIFMDMDLIGDQFVGDRTKNYSAVQAAIQACLGDSNGPYILITWSTYDEHAEELIAHLNERLPAGLRPAYCKRLDKTDLADLSDKVETYLSDMGPTGCLINWEKYIINASSVTIQELINLTSRVNGIDQRDALIKLLFDLAHAEAGRHVSEGNATGHLYSMLSQILSDKLLQQPIEVAANCDEIINTGNGIRVDVDWKSKVNTILNIDMRSSPVSSSTPGDVVVYPGEGHNLPVPNINTNKFLRGNFMSFVNDTEKTSNKAAIEAGCKLVLIEITPSCDYAQNKHVWNKYVVSALVPTRLLKFTYLIDRSNPEASIRHESMHPDYIRCSPTFRLKDEEEYVVLVNSKLLISLDKSIATQDNLGVRLFRIKKTLIGDILGWLARQHSRLGYVSL